MGNNNIGGGIKMKKGTIKCDVETCKHNNCGNGCCELDEIKISLPVVMIAVKKQKKPSVKVLKNQSRGRANKKIPIYI